MFSFDCSEDKEASEVNKGSPGGLLIVGSFAEDHRSPSTAVGLKELNVTCRLKKQLEREKQEKERLREKLERAEQLLSSRVRNRPAHVSGV